MEPRAEKNVAKRNLPPVSGFLDRGNNTLLQPIGLHLLAGAVTGAAFRAPALLIGLSIVFFEFIALLAIVQCTAALQWILVNATVIEVGYLIGMAVRQFVEHAGRLAMP